MLEFEQYIRPQVSNMLFTFGSIIIVVVIVVFAHGRSDTAISARRAAATSSRGGSTVETRDSFGDLLDEILTLSLPRSR